MKESDIQLIKIAEELKNLNYETEKKNIFDYNTLNEDRGASISVEIGGPSAHIKLWIQTRKEHDLIQNAIVQILNSRRNALDNRLNVFCNKNQEF
jgi:hypothetical protein